MKTEKTSNEKKSQKTNPPPHCGDFQKMAEMMKTFCPEEGNATDCCSIMSRMMGPVKGTEVKETKETQKQQKTEKTGKNFKPTRLSAYQNERR